MAIDTSDVEILSQARDWLHSGHRVELVTVARTWGSSPRPAGSMAAVRDDGAIVGSVSGGCVERELAESFVGAHENRLLSHHIDDEQARRYGLTCGGRLELVFETLAHASVPEALLEQIAARKRMRRITTVGESVVRIESADPDDGFAFDGSTMQQVFGPTWRLLLVGAGQLSRYVAEFAQTLEFEVVVCEPRAPFRHAWHVPGVTLLDTLPDDAVLDHARDVRSAALALSHDPALDDLALQEALDGQAFYIGALGSRRSHDRRCERLRGLGVDDGSLGRIHAPIGLDIGSRTSAEIAVSIVAELVAARAGKLGVTTSRLAV